MRILLISPYFYPHKGGSQQYAEELHYNLMQKDPSVHVDVLCYNTDKTKRVEKYRGMTIYRIPCFQILKGQFAVPNYFQLARVLRSLFKKHSYDFINSHTRFFETSWWTPFVARHFHTTSLLTDHCSSHPVHSSSFITWISYMIDRYFVPQIIKKYDFVSVTNKTTQKFLKKLGIQNTSVIYGGVDIKSFHKTKTFSKRTLPGFSCEFTKNDLVISFVGRMIYSKGPHLLLDAAQKITQSNKNVYVLFAGDGHEFQKLSKYQTKQILFLGSLEKERVAKLLSITDILVHPSLHHEGFPNVLLEAAASGCAIIATDMGGTHEIITKNTGILIKPAKKSIEESLAVLIKNKSLRERYGQNARKWIEKNYSWGKIAKEYQRFITQTILSK